MVLFLYTKEISPVIGEKQNVIDLKMHNKQCMQLLFLEYCLSLLTSDLLSTNAIFCGFVRVKVIFPHQQ